MCPPVGTAYPPSKSDKGGVEMSNYTIYMYKLMICDNVPQVTFFTSGRNKAC